MPINELIPQILLGDMKIGDFSVSILKVPPIQAYSILQVYTELNFGSFQPNWLLFHSHFVN